MLKLKKIIITVLIIIFLLIIILLIYIHKNKEGTIYETDKAGYDEEINKIDPSLQLVNDRNEFYVVKTCIGKFYYNYSSIFDTDNSEDVDTELSADEIKKESEKAVYDMLDTDYINYKNISEDNVSTKLEEVKKSVVNINQMLVSQKTDDVYVYIAQGKLREIKSGNISDFKIMVKVDAVNKTFKVLLGDYINQNYNNIKIGDVLNINVDDKIEENYTNIYDYEFISDEQYVTDLFAKYQEETLFDEDDAYYHLDEEYRNKRFGTIDNFKKYLHDNIEKNVTMKLSKYQRNVYDDYTEYICLDEDGNYYFFNESSIMNYSMYLDAYTIDSPKFVERYNNLNDADKGLLDVRKIISAMKEKDYKYIYSKLDTTFKENNFHSINVFGEYMNRILYDENDITVESYQHDGDVHSYTISIKDKNNEASQSISKTFFVRLKEGTDFIISFNV